MKTKTRILSLILCMAMVIGYFTFGVSAEVGTGTYTMIDRVENLTAGTYKMAAYLTVDSNKNDLSAAPYHLATGTISSGDLETASYAYSNNVLTAASNDDAVDIELIAVDNKTDTYYIKYDGKYLYSSASGTNRKLGWTDEATEWVASDNSKGGITLTSNSVYLGTAVAASRLLRSYKSESTLNCGVVFFKAGAASTDPVDPCTHTNVTVTYNETNHWNVCSDCKEIVEGTTEAHELDANGDCTGCDHHEDPSEPEEPTTGSTFVKVTEAPTDWSGTYLIVSEVNGTLYVFDGSLETLDAVNDYAALNEITVNGDTITTTTEKAFTIAAVNGGYTIQSASGYYIGQTSNANGLLAKKDTTYTNTLSLAEDGSATIAVAAGPTLRFNSASNQMRFRYYKSGQQPVYLYKEVSESTEKFTVEKTNMRFGSDLSLLFAFKQSDIADLSAVKAKIVQSTDSGSETVYVNGSGWTTTTIDEVDYYVVEYSGIAGKEMSDEVTIVVEDAEGNELSTSFTTSIRTYAMARLENTTDAEFKGALVDMLNYGAAAQTYFENYNAENPANALLTPAQEDLASAEGEYEDKRSISDENIVKASNLRFASKISMLFSLNATCQNTYAVFTWKDHKGADHEVKVETYSTLEDGSLVVELTGLVVADARQMVTCTIYGQNNNAVAVVTDSVESYAARCSEDTVDLAVAFMKFADSAYAYLH